MSQLVSIIIPTFNRADLLGETLQSVREQSYTNWECIVVDDGSDDETQKLAKKYIDKDSRFQYHLRPDRLVKGANSCRNHGYGLSKGGLINWLDDDDLFSENKIEEQVKLFSNDDVDIATCKWGRFKQECKFHTKELEIYRDYKSGANLLQAYGETNTFFPSHTFMIRREVIDSSGLWKEGLAINQDGEFFCRVMLNAGKIKCATKCNVQYRIPETENTSAVQNEQKARDLIDSWKLISDNLQRSHPTKFDAYLKNSKDYVFDSLHPEYRDLLKQHRDFFKEQFKQASFFNRLKKKLF